MVLCVPSAAAGSTPAVPIAAEQDPDLSARIVKRVPLTYREEGDAIVDRPAYVRSASAVTWFKDHLAVIQDDANWLALIDTDNAVHAIALPADAHGERVFDGGRGNRERKTDLAACITVPGEGGLDLIGFGSGRVRGREWVLRVHEGKPWSQNSHRHTHDITGLQVSSEFLDASGFYESLRATPSFCGSGLNIQGAITVGDGDTIILFNRGDAPSDGEQQPVDAMGSVSWHQLAKHLADPDNVPPPALTTIQPFDLGRYDGARLTFSDATFMEGPILYAASAEQAETGEISGAALGVIEPDSTARWALVKDESGQPFRGRIEGLAHHPTRTRRIHFVIDDADESVPAEIFEAELHGDWPFD
jgi:hypothetical protein